MLHLRRWRSVDGRDRAGAGASMVRPIIDREVLRVRDVGFTVWGVEFKGVGFKGVR